MPAPTAVGSVVSRNFCAGSKPYCGPRNSTKADHMLQMQKPTCSDRIEKTRLRRAMRSPVVAQNTGSSGLQSSIQWSRAVGGDATAATSTVLVCMSVHPRAIRLPPWFPRVDVSLIAPVGVR